LGFHLDFDIWVLDFPDVNAAIVRQYMITKSIDVLIIGAGPAGLAAAIAAKEAGINKLVIIERNDELGGILNQCIHDGFGLEIFEESLTGPEYIQRYIDKIEDLKIPYMTGSMVIDIEFDKKTKNKLVYVTSSSGLIQYKTKAVVLCMGCRERTRGALVIPGTRPAGIFTAGVAQNFINLQNLMVGNEVVVLGSGDIGMIMARRLTLEGAKVKAVVEILPYASGLPRNVVQCLEDYDIPLLLNHTVTNIKGKDRVKGVTIAKVDKNMKPIKRTERRIKCDTLILSVGLIPENELSKKINVELDNCTDGAVVNDNLETTTPGVFACGNVLHVHDIVDWVTFEAEKAGDSAALFVKNLRKRKPARQKGNKIDMVAGAGIRYVLPHNIRIDGPKKLHLRVDQPARKVTIQVREGRKVYRKIKKPRVNPPEMITINLKPDLFQDQRPQKKLIVEAK
jgi:thioredoxin reductase